MVLYPFCCEKCFGTKGKKPSFVAVTVCHEPYLSTVPVCPCRVREFKWNGEVDFGSFIYETCTECGEVGNCSSMVALDYEEPEGEEKYICSPLCLQKWVAKNKKTVQ